MLSLANKLSKNYNDEIDIDDLYLYLNERGENELKQKKNNLNHNNFINFNSETIKTIRKKTQDYSVFGWYKYIYKINDHEVIRICNDEGFIYLYYQRITAYLFGFLSIFSILILFPVCRLGENNDKISSILKPTVANIYGNKLLLWIILIFSLFYTFVSYYHLYIFAKMIVKMKSKDESTNHSLDNLIPLYTLHIRGINQDLSYLDAKKIIEAFFENHFNSLIIGIQLIPNYDMLTKLIDQKFTYQGRYDEYYNENIKNNPIRKKITKDWFFKLKKSKIDAEIYYMHLSEITNNMLNFYRSLNSKKNTGNAFIVFKTPEMVNKILKNQNLIFSKMNSFEGKLLKMDNWLIKKAPSPSDIIWDNIKYSKKWRKIRMLFFNISLFIICLIIITPNYINNELSPLINDISMQIDNKNLRSIITEYSYTLIVVIMNSGVIPVIVGYIAMAELHYKRSYREKSIFYKNVIFMVINCFFIPTFGVLNFEKIKNGLMILIKIHWDFDVSEGFIKNAYFFMRYIIQVTFISNGIQLLALPQFFVKKFRVFIASSDYEKFYASLVKKYFDYGYNYSFSITVFMLTLCFSTTIPLITPFGFLFFLLKYYIDKYNLLFLYPAEFESHGNVTDLVIKFDLIGIFFFQFIISNLFLKIFHNKYYSFFATILYLILSLFIYSGMKHLFNVKNNKPNIFERVLNKSGLNDFIFNNRNITDNRLNNMDLKTSFLSKKDKMPEKITEDELLKLMREAYVHPAEKNQVVNPMQIWNDAYTYLKTNNQDYKIERIYKRYEDIIEINERINI